MSAPTSWRTALTEATDDGVRIRGYDLRDLVGGISFAEGILLMARGELPTKGEARLLEAILVSVLDRGIVPCSVVTRYLASSGSPIQAAVAGGILSFGDVYGGAVGRPHRLYLPLEVGEPDSAVVVDSLAQRHRPPGQLDEVRP